MNAIYLDNNASTAPWPEVIEAMNECSRSAYANPSSQHQFGRRARQALEEAREGIARLLGAKLGGQRGDRLLFTSGGTEANNLALLGIAGREPGRIVASPVEHPSVTGPVAELARRGCSTASLAVDPAGRVSLEQLRECLTAETRLVTVMLGNHETGVLQPVEQVAALCNDAGVPLHTDAVQAAGKIPIDFRCLGAAALTVSAHKFHGPRGIGALLIRHDVLIDPILFGGFQQTGLRPGTEPVTLAVGMFKALEMWHQDAERRGQRMARLRDRFEGILEQHISNLTVNGRNAPRLPHVSNVAFRGLDRQAMAIAIDLAGVACSTGSACASGSSEPSPVLLAMGLPDEVVQASLRFSLGAQSTEEDVEEAANRIINIYNALRLVAESRKLGRTSRHGIPKEI